MDPEEEGSIRAGIQEAFENARGHGVRMNGLYGCRWSSHQKYFSFWQCPSFSVLETAIDELEQAGDFVFASPEHFVGVPTSDEGFEEEEPAAFDPANYPFAFVAFWRRSPAFFSASAEERKAHQIKIHAAFDFGREQGIQMLGMYDCRWSSNWDYFTYWASPNFRAIEDTILRLETAGDFLLSESHHVIGAYEPEFQSGWHSQA